MTAPLKTTVFYAAAGLLMAAGVGVALEIVGRTADPLGVSYYPETARYMDTLVLDDSLGYRNRPGLHGNFFGVPVDINASGLRDRELDVDSSAGEFRVAILGDSFVFGIGVRSDQSIPAMVEQVLNEQAPPGVRFRTINFGVPSYNTEQELEQLRSIGLRDKPKVVALLFAMNDIYPKMWVFEKRRALLPNLAQRSYAVSLLFGAYRLTQASLSSPDAVAGLENYRTDHPRWLAIDRSLSAINAACRERGIPFVVFSYDELERRPVGMVQAVGDREGFPVINLIPWRDPRWRGQNPRRFVNSAIDAHPNPSGCRIYGTLIAEALSRLGLVPSRSTPPSKVSD